MGLLRHVYELVYESIMGWSQNEATTYAAALAYYTIFSLAPALVIITAIAAIVFNDAAVESRIVTEIDQLLGPDVAEFIDDIISNSQNVTSTGIAAIISIGLLFYGASTFFYKLRLALNAMWNIIPRATDVTRGIIAMVGSRLLAAVSVVVLGFLLMGSLLVSSILTALPQTILEYFLPNPDILITAISILSSPILFCVVFALVFQFLPNAKIRWRDVWVGAAVTAILFWLGGYIISIYLSISGLASLYGAAGALVVFLIWVYYSVWIFLLGAKFTQLFADRFGAPVVPDDKAMFRPDPYAGAPTAQPYQSKSR